MDERITNFINRANFENIAIKHSNNTDVVFVVTRGYIDNSEEASIALNGYWVNIMTQKPYVIDMDTIFIKNGDISNWHEVHNPLR